MAKTKAERQKNREILPFLYILIGFIVVLLISTALQATKKDIYKEACLTLCQDKGLKYASYGFKTNTSSMAWQDYLICFCHTDNLSKQITPYDFKTSAMYSHLFKGR